MSEGEAFIEDHDFAGEILSSEAHRIFFGDFQSVADENERGQRSFSLFRSGGKR